MTILKAREAHIWERDEHDWYVEPPECSLALFMEEEFDGVIWDPAAGLCRIPESARRMGIATFSSDIKKRNYTCDECGDFFEMRIPEGAKSIVSNPPFKLAEDFVRRSIDICPRGGKIAMLLPLVWMAGFSTKRDWLPTSPLLRIFSISPRPSMPPGAVILAGQRPGNGTKDFAWFVWQKGYTGTPKLGFLNTNKAKRSLKA